MGFGGGRGMRNDGYLNTLKFLLRKKKKKPGKSKADHFSHNGREKYEFKIMVIFAGECKLLENKIILFLMDILRFFIKDMKILDKDGIGCD